MLSEKSLLILASDCIDVVTQLTNSEFTVLREFDGSLLYGMEYMHPLDGSRVRKLQSADHVSTDKGTGLVHTAPAHGLEDFIVAQENHLSVVNPNYFYGRYFSMRVYTV